MAASMGDEARALRAAAEARRVLAAAFVLPLTPAPALLHTRAPQFAGPEPSLERAFRGHRGGVAALAFNPNMRQLVSGGLDGDVLVWNFKPSLRAYRFAGHTARATGSGSWGGDAQRTCADAHTHASAAAGERQCGCV